MGKEKEDYFSKGIASYRKNNFIKAITLLGQAGSSPEVDCYIAMAHLGLADYAAVKEIAARVIEENPEYGLAYSIKARALHKTFCYKEAQKVFEEASKISPDDHTYNVYYIDYLVDCGNQEKALNYATNFLRKPKIKGVQNLDNKKIYHALAKIYGELHLVKESIEVLQTAIKEDPDDSYSCAMLGDIYRKLGNYPVARKYYQEAMDISPNYWLPYAFAGIAYEELGINNYAMLMFKKALDLNDRYPYINTLYASSLKILGEFQEADRILNSNMSKLGNMNPIDFLELTYSFFSSGWIEDTKKWARRGMDECKFSISQNPSEVMLYVTKIEFLKLAQDFPGMFKTWQEMLDFECHNPQHYIQKIEGIVKYSNIITYIWGIKMELGIVRNILGILYQASLKYPDNPIIEFKYAIFLAQAGFYNDAIRCFDNALAHGLNTSELYKEYGDLRTARGEYEEAEAMYQKALEVNEYNMHAHSNYGYLLGRWGRTEEALQHYAQAMSLNIANDPKILRNYAKTLCALRQYEKGIEILSNILAENLEISGPVQVSLGGTCRDSMMVDRGVINNASPAGTTTSYSYSDLAKAYYDIHNYDLAMIFCNNAMQMDATNSDAFAYIGKVYVSKNNLQIAEQMFLRAISLGTNFEWVFSNMSTLCMMRKQYDQAMAYAQKARELMPDNPEAVQNLERIEEVVEEVLLEEFLNDTLKEVALAGEEGIEE